MDALGSAGFVLRNISLAKTKELDDVNALASGLRVRSASDDPSGYAIAQTLQSRVSGLQQSVGNVQTANNALAVADAALSTVQDVLQRIRTLTVEAASDFESQDDLSRIQTEIGQLLDEINKVSESVQFNGRTLLNGAFDTSPGVQAAWVQVPSPAAPTNAVTSGSDVGDADGAGNAGPLITFTAPPVYGGNFTPAFMVFTITGYSDDAIDPDSGADVGPGVYFQAQFYSTDPAFGAAPMMTDTTAIAVNSGQIGPTSYANPGSYSGGPSLLLLNNFVVANLTAGDVGASIAFVTTAAKAAGTGSSLYVNDGGGEGTVVPIDLPAMNTTALGLNGITVMAPAAVDVYDDPIGQVSGNQLAVYDAQSRVDSALQSVETARAQVGAQTVSLGEDADNASLTIVNETASESSIRDADIGATATDYTKQQLLGSIGTTVLANIQADAQMVVRLVAAMAA